MSNEGNRFTPPSGTQSPDHIRASGDVKTKIAIIWFVGIISGILATGGMIAFFVDSEKSKDIWVIIGPIITAAVTGTVAIFSSRDDKK